MIVGQRVVLWPDSIAYYEWGVRLGTSFDFVKHPIYRTPFYPLFLAVFFRFGETAKTITAIVTAQHLLGLASVALVYFIARKAFDQRVAFFSALLFGLHTLQLYYETVIQTEVLFIFLLLLVVYCFLEFLPDFTARRGALIGALLVCLTLTRPLGKLIILLLLLALYFDKRSLRQILRPALAMIVVYLLGLSVWCFENQRSDGFFGLSRDSGLNAFHRVFDIDQRTPPINTAYPQVAALIKHFRLKGQTVFVNVYFTLGEETHSLLHADKLMYASAVEAAKFDWLFVVNTARNWSKLFLDADSSVTICRKFDREYLCAAPRAKYIQAVDIQQRSRHRKAGFQIIGYFENAALPMGLISVSAFFGAALALYRRKDSLLPQFLMVGLIMYFSLLTALTNRPHDRFRLPIDSFLIVFAMYAASVIWSQVESVIKARRTK